MGLGFRVTITITFLYSLLLLLFCFLSFVCMIPIRSRCLGSGVSGFGGCKHGLSVLICAKFPGMKYVVGWRTFGLF